MKKIYLVAALSLIVFQTKAQTLTSSDLPLIIINSNGQPIPDEPKITADMGIIYNANGVRNNITDPFNHYKGKIGIEIRGQSSQQFPMKSYSIELRDATGNSQDKSLFGMPKESDWVLYAPYNEKTLMHNFLAYTMAREMGRWAANCRYAEVVINGDYKGIYILMEKIKRNSNRVNISKLAATDVAGDAVTGGYIFAIDKQPDAWYSVYATPFSSKGQKIRYSYTYPKVTAIVPAQQAYLQSYVDSFEKAFNSLEYQDKQNGWRRFADESSFIDYFLINEVSRNVDGYRLSTYMYKDKQSKGGKIIAGPVWDYDLAFRNANYCEGSNTTGWSYDFNKVCSEDFWQVPFWWSQLAKDSAFQSNLRCRWKQLRLTSLSTSRINFLIDSITNLTTEARLRHFQRWPVLGQYIWPNPQPIPATYQEEVAVLKDWLQKRLNWIDKAIPNTGGCYDYPASVQASILLNFYPNPLKNQLTLNIKSRNNQSIQVNVVDASGRQLLLKSYNLNYGENIFQLPANNWATGIYFLRYKSANGESGIAKLVKQ